MDRKIEGRNENRGRHPGYFAARLITLLALGFLWAPLARAEVVDRIVANVNGSIILLSEVQDQLALLSEVQKRGMGMSMAELTERNVMEDMIDEKLVTSYASEKEITIKPSEVDKALENIKIKNGLDDKSFNQAIQSQGTTMEKFRERVENQLLVQRVLQIEVDMVTPTEEEAMAFYESHKSEFIGEGKVKARHILIKVPSGGDDTEARERILRIKAEIEAGANFGEMAKKYSEGPSAPMGGELGWFSRSDVVSAFSKAAFALDEGRMSGPVRTEFGVHLIQVLEKEKVAAVAYEVVAERIKGEISRQAFETKRVEWLARIRGQAFIEIMY
ncbi:MAG: peptidylprolyl isomerase [Nitrospinota bacterium]|nr:peptidylprolyl isomerase [Nitrospinota bacterium]MDH5755244.1 peptidylprolyl isomerase [Nitrospinota bacterium]